MQHTFAIKLRGQLKIKNEKKGYRRTWLICMWLLIFSTLISGMKENMKLFFIKFVDDTIKERALTWDLYGRVLAASRLRG